MRGSIISGAAAIALAVTMGAATAAQTGSMMKSTNDTLNLTSAQRHDIYRDVDKQANSQKAPTGFTAKVGEAVPSSITTSPLPADAAKQVSAVKAYHFAMIGKDVLLVNPTSSKIAAVITR
jgi:hypothetical protein